MSMKPAGTVIIVIALTLLGSSVRAEDSTGVDSVGVGSANTAEEALALALKFTGFTEAEGVNMDQAGNSAHLVTFVDTLTPFLHDSMNGRQVWSITFDDLVWDIKGSRKGLKDERHKWVEVSIDQETGRLFRIKAVTVGDEPDDSCCQKPSARSAEIQMSRSGTQRYHGFPRVDPGLSFHQALELVHGSPLSAHEIVALYVMYSSMKREPTAVWDIHLYGLPPVPAPSPDIPINQRNHWRTVIDVNSERAGFSNCPHPIEIEQ